MSVLRILRVFRLVRHINTVRLFDVGILFPNSRTFTFLIVQFAYLFPLNMKMCLKVNTCTFALYLPCSGSGTTLDRTSLTSVVYLHAVKLWEAILYADVSAELSKRLCDRKCLPDVPAHVSDLCDTLTPESIWAARRDTGDPQSPLGGPDDA